MIFTALGDGDATGAPLLPIAADPELSELSADVELESGSSSGPEVVLVAGCDANGSPVPFPGGGFPVNGDAGELESLPEESGSGKPVELEPVEFDPDICVVELKPVEFDPGPEVGRGSSDVGVVELRTGESEPGVAVELRAGGLSEVGRPLGTELIDAEGLAGGTGLSEVGRPLGTELIEGEGLARGGTGISGGEPPVGIGCPNLDHQGGLSEWS